METHDKENADAVEVQDVTIPSNVYVQCPLAGKKLRAVSVCLECEHYVGFRQRFQSGHYPFATNYQVACRFPFARALFEMESKCELAELFKGNYEPSRSFNHDGPDSILIKATE